MKNNEVKTLVVLKILAIVAILLLGVLWGALMGYILPIPFNFIAACIGGFTIGWVGMEVIRRI